MNNIDLNKLCGAKPSPIDERDYKFGSLIGSISEIPSYHNYSDEIVRDQGSSSMCGAFAGAAYRYSQEWYQSNNRDLFSTSMIYGADSSYSGEGMYGRTLASILVSTGVCKLKDWEKIGTKSECRNIYKKYKDEVSVECKKYRSSSYYYCNSWTEILLAIYSTNGCIIMVPIYDNWYNCPNGIVGKTKGKFYGYHFITALDYTKKSNGFYRIRFKNSWGKYWGDNGYGYLDTDVNGFTEAFAIIDNINEVKEMLYKDVDENKWYSEAIEKVSKVGLMQGDGDGTFRPNDPVTRAELASVLCKLKEL